MKTFEFNGLLDPAAAVATAAHARTAQQGADVRFIAGGTTLLDLMKTECRNPARVLELPFALGQIGATRDGGLTIGAQFATQISRTIRPCREICSASRRRFSLGHRPNSATWRRLRAICFSEHVACISATQPWPATSASPVPAAPANQRQQSQRWPSLGQSNIA